MEMSQASPSQPRTPTYEEPTHATDSFLKYKTRKYLSQVAAAAAVVVVPAVLRGALTPQFFHKKKNEDEEGRRIEGEESFATELLQHNKLWQATEGRLRRRRRRG